MLPAGMIGVETRAGLEQETGFGEGNPCGGTSVSTGRGV